MPIYSFQLEFLHSLILLLRDMTVTMLDLSSGYIPWLACVFNFDFLFLCFPLVSLHRILSLFFSSLLTFQHIHVYNRTLAHLPSFLPLLTSFLSSYFMPPLNPFMSPYLMLSAPDEVKINLMGIAIGNGVIDEATQARYALLLCYMILCYIIRYSAIRCDTTEYSDNLQLFLLFYWSSLPYIFIPPPATSYIMITTITRNNNTVPMHS